MIEQFVVWLSRNYWIRLVLAGAVAVIGLGVIVSQPKHIAADRDSHAQVQPSAATKPQEPPLANLTLHAYDLLKNPFGHQNQIVALNVIERPVMYNNSVIQYADIGGADPRVATQLGLTGVRLNRMLPENIALYDIVGLNANYNSDSQVLGQLVVVLPMGKTELELGRYWDVEPLGVVDGTNGFGANIQVPRVRFWRYTDERSRTTQKLSGDGQKAVNLVKTRITPTQYLMALQPDFKWERWEVRNNNDVCDSCWHVEYAVKVIAKSTSQYDFYQSGDWDVNIKSQTVTPVDRTYRDPSEADRKPGEPLDVTTHLFQTTQ
jgi:hypothetical protein